jgi:dipeptidase E
VFGGGGEADDERPLLDAFAQLVGKRTLLYLPIASDPPLEPYLRWIRAALRPSGVATIEMVTSVENLAGELRRAEAVFIGGGNIYTLLDTLRVTGADTVLRRAAQAGRPVYGGSAGAILLGRDVDTARHADPNTPGVTDTTGLDLALGYAIWCHFSEADASRVRDYVSATGNEVIALSERSGLVRDGNTMRVAGYQPATVFRPRGDLILGIGELVPASGV